MRSRPPAYPTRLPVEPTIRWHGTTIGTGFRLRAPPTARAAFGFPMRAASRPFGVYAVYSYDELSEPDDVVQFLADVIGTAVLREASAPGTDDIWSGRSVIYQATGMVSVQLQVSPVDALAMLRAHAFAHDTTLNEIAEHVVARRIDFRTR